MLYKCLFGVNIKCGYKIWQIDIITAFLYKFINKIIYIKQLYQFIFNSKLIYYFCKVLYTLKQVL